MPTLSEIVGRRLPAVLPKLLLSSLVLLAGFWIANAPLKAWLLIGALAALALSEIEPIYWVIASILAAVLSRAVVAVGAPHFLNFLHFPLVAGGALVAAWKGRSQQPVALLLGTGLLAFLVVNLISWALNGGETARPLLNWLVLVEPFLLVYALAKAFPDARLRSKIWLLIVTLGAVQVILGLYQWLRVSHGNPDLVQGSFIASGTGAHVAGAVALLGVLVTVSKACTAKQFSERLLLFAVAAPLLGLSVIADAKQVIFCFMPGLLLAILNCTRLRPSQLFAPFAFAGALFYLAFLLYPPLQIIANKSLVSEGLAGKAEGISTIAGMLWHRPGGWLFGLGPGDTVSRVALLTPDANLDTSSSVAALGLKTAPETRQLLAMSASNYIWSSSSVWSPICSWFGLFGDLGLAGVVLYLWIAGVLWRGLGREKNWRSAAAKGSLLMTAALGGVYDWLEEPAFTLLVALITGLALLDRQAALQQEEPRSRPVALPAYWS